MPQIIVAAIASYAGPAIAGAVGLTAGTIAYGVVSGLASAVVGYALSSALGLNKPPKQAAFSAVAQDRQQMIRSAVATRAVVFGAAMMSGPIVFAASTGASHEYLHVVIPVAHGESQEIVSIQFGDELVGDLDGAGNVTTGRFAGKMRIKKHLGTTAQAADGDLVAEVTEWTTAHRLQGITYLYARLQYDATIYPYGLENLKALVKGRKVYDPRTTSSYWTDNWALCMADYLTATHGLRATGTELDYATHVTAQANLCDERVLTPTISSTVNASAATDVLAFAALERRYRTGDGMRLTTSGTLPAPLVVGTTYYFIRVSDSSCKLASSVANALAGIAIDLTDAGSGIHTLSRYDQARYACNGSVDLGNKIVDNLKGLLTGAVGQLVYTQGIYKLYAAAYDTPTLDLNEDDLRGSITLQARPARQDLFNGVRGTYVSPDNFWQPADFPQVLNPTYEAQDGGEQILKDVELPYTIDTFAAQRMAKIVLERARQGTTGMAPCKLTAFKLAAWDTFRFTVAQLGWSTKAFRVTKWVLHPTGGVDLEFQEEASASYSWSSGEATTVDPAPDTTLPSLVTVAPPTALTCYSGNTYQLAQADGLKLCRIFATWTASADALVSSYEIQHKLTTDTDYQSAVIPAAVLSAYIAPVQSGSSYHVRIRGVRQNGAVSAWEGPLTIAASSDASTVSATVAYGDITGTKPPVNADNTVGAVEAGATVTSGGITFSAGGAIKGGATNFLTGTGWFLGYSGGAYKFSIGDPSGAYMSWDGVNLSVKGNIINNIQYTAGGTLHSDLTQVSNIYVGQFDTITVKSWTCTANGTITVNADLAYATGFTAVGLDVSIRKNGVIQGGEYILTQVSPTYYTLSRSFTAAIGDTITVVAATPSSPTYCNVKNFTVTIASVNVIAASQDSFTTTSSTYVLAKKIQMPSGGVIQALFDLWCASGTAYGRVYKNGVAVGTERTTTSSTPVSWTENISFSANDTIELWIKNSSTNSTYNKRFELAVNQALTVPVTLQ